MKKGESVCEEKIKKWREHFKARGEEAKSKSKKSNYIGSIVINLILLYIFNHLQNWQVPFLINGWEAVLWVLNISIAATIIANFLFLLFDDNWFRNLLNIILNIISIFVLITSYEIFPYNFGIYSGADWNYIANIFIIIGIIGTSIALIVNFFRLVFNLSPNR